MHELILVSQENVFRHRQTGQCPQLLHDDGDTLVVGLHLVLRVDFLAVQDELAAADAVNTRQHIGQRGLAGAVLADEGMHLALVDIERNILHRLRDTEGFAEILNL